MAFKAKSTGTALPNKVYFWCQHDNGAGIRDWIYVTADALTTVDGSGYIDDQSTIDVLNIGDRIWVYVADAIDDSRSITDDLKNGMADYGLLLVMDNTGSVVDLSNDLLGGTVTYGD